VQEVARASALVPALQNASLDSFSVAKYPYPQDALPIVGWLPGKEGKVYVAVTHSGATLGPLLGRLVAEEIMGREQAVLRHYRPGRDFSDSSHLY
jgi:glycine/D-amino acid oxidase-like deaminating enzyme